MARKQDREYVTHLRQKLYPSPIFANDSTYLQFIDNILLQTEEASNKSNVAFYIPAKNMMDKKVFHDFLMETKRRFILEKINRPKNK